PAAAEVIVNTAKQTATLLRQTIVFIGILWGQSKADCQRNTVYRCRRPSNERRVNDPIGRTASDPSPQRTDPAANHHRRPSPGDLRAKTPAAIDSNRHIRWPAPVSGAVEPASGWPSLSKLILLCLAPSPPRCALIDLIDSLERGPVLADLQFDRAYPW